MSESSILGLEHLDVSFYIIFYTITFIFGICIGSFLNVLICRLPGGESIIKSSSHCVKCGAKIRRRDLIPIFSWILLKGKCHSCGEKISPRYPIVELLNGLIYIITFFVLDFNVKSIIFCVFFSLLIVLSFIDLDTFEIYPSFLIIIGVLAILSGIFSKNLTVLQRITGALFISVPFFIIGEISAAIILKNTGERIRGIELGDTLFMFVSGALVGNKCIVISAFFGIVAAAIGGIIQKRKSGESKFAFAPYLSIGLFFGTLFGNQLVDKYMSLFM